MLEVGDRLFSAFGQDTIDALLWTATEPRARSRSTHAKHLGTLPHLLFALAYVRILFTHRRTSPRIAVPIGIRNHGIQVSEIPHVRLYLDRILSQTVLHSILVLFQATTLNVAINSSNKALLTIMMSNNVSTRDHARRSISPIDRFFFRALSYAYCALFTGTL